MTKEATLIWRPNALQPKLAKQGNVAGLLATEKLRTGPLQLHWRLRLYKEEKLVAAAKPLWFLPKPLSLKKGQVQRVV